jgi:uncharacterized protein
MIKYPRAIISVLLLVCPPSIWAEGPLAGDWMGGFERGDNQVFEACQEHWCCQSPRDPIPQWCLLTGQVLTSAVIIVLLALNSVAALMCDKRGCGTSTGAWLKSGFDDFADDALAGVELLIHRPGINPHRIGLWGVSQGGWVVGLAAARSTNVAFIISVSGPGITPEAQGAFAIEHRMKAAGFSDADLSEALSLYHWNSRCARTGTGWDAVDAAIAAARHKPWYDNDVDPHGPGDQKQWQLIWDYDPAPVLRKVHCPVLSIFGELDPLVPARQSADIWKTELTKAGNRDATIRIFPYADHNIRDTREGIPRAEYFTLQRDWLSKHVKASPQWRVLEV